MPVPQIYFNSGTNTLIGNISIPKSEYPLPAVLICHGGGKSNKQRFEELQDHLWEQDIISFAFDFTGVGESEGNFREGTLEKRLQDAQAAIDMLKHLAAVDSQKLFVIGTSMGGHIAARLTEQNKDVKGVILLYAAAYGSETETKLLNEEFTAALHKPSSWRDSRAFSNLRHFPGKILVIYGQNDDVIPDEVKKEFRKIAPEAYYELEHGRHLLFNPENNEQEKVTEKVYSLIDSFLLESLK